ncbi:MAG: AAA family ATPase, partial [Planctomycetes bacterium]|nr:AAA family ATPase [Planctomycetota bacterium]
KRAAFGSHTGDTGAEIARQRMRSSIEDALKRTFRPELLNRIDEVIIFDPLTKEQVILLQMPLGMAMMARSWAHLTGLLVSSAMPWSSMGRVTLIAAMLKL